MNTFDNLRYEIKHVRNPISKKSEDWQKTADKWLVVFMPQENSEGFTVDYYTGVGLRKKGVLCTPKIKDIIHAMYMDSLNINANFKDWCAEIGLNDDSIKAFENYKSCAETSIKLKRLNFSEEYLDKSFENY